LIKEPIDPALKGSNFQVVDSREKWQFFIIHIEGVKRAIFDLAGIYFSEMK
jgi:hypothetical protein